MKFNPDGSIVQMTMTKEGVAPVATLNPYQRVEAETIAWESGVKTIKSATVGVYVTGIHNGSYIKVCNVEFGDKGAAKFIASVAGSADGSAIELRLDSETGPIDRYPQSQCHRWTRTNGIRNHALSAVRKASMI